MMIVAIAVVVAVPASLHAYSVGALGFQFDFVDLPVFPDICHVAVRSPLHRVALIDVLLHVRAKSPPKS